MSAIVDTWVSRLKGKLPAIGEMTHWERMANAFELKRTDFVPVAPELDYWQITYAGYTHQEIYNDVDKTTSACLETWAHLRTDAIWMYVDISHQIENFIPAERRAQHFIHRGPKDYLLYKPLVNTLDEAIELYESKAYARHLEGSRPITHYTPHMLQLLEFQEKMNRQVPIIVGAATPSNYAETIVEVQQFVKWMITEPKAKMHHYLQLCLDERLAALDFYRDYAAKNGCEFFACFGGARTWGPKQMREFGDYDRKFVEKAKTIFPHVLWHICGHNLPLAMEMLGEWDGIQAVQYDMPYYSQQIEWPEWCESIAKLYKGKRCAANAPTTQVACHGSRQDVDRMVSEFIEGTLPHTTACVMPGCEVDSFTSMENVQQMIDTARRYKPA